MLCSSIEINFGVTSFPFCIFLSFCAYMDMVCFASLQLFEVRSSFSSLASYTPFSFNCSSQQYIISPFFGHYWQIFFVLPSFYCPSPVLMYYLPLLGGIKNCMYKTHFALFCWFHTSRNIFKSKLENICVNFTSKISLCNFFFFFSQVENICFFICY